MASPPVTAAPRKPNKRVVLMSLFGILLCGGCLLFGAWIWLRRSEPALHIWQLEGSSYGADPLLFDASGQTLLVRVGHQLQQRRIPDGALLQTIGDPAAFTALLNDDNTLLASLTRTDTWVLAVWRVADGQLLQRITIADGLPEPQSFSPDDTIVVTKGQPREPLRFWRVADGTLLWAFEDARGYCFTPDGRVLVVRYGQGSLEVWRVADQTVLHRQALTQQPSRDSVNAVVCSDDGRSAMLKNVDDSRLQLQLDSFVLQVQAKEPLDGVRERIVSPSGRFEAVTMHGAGSVELRRTDQAPPVFRMPWDASQPSSSIAFSANELLIALPEPPAQPAPFEQFGQQRRPQTVVLRRTDTGQVVRRLRSISPAVATLRFNPDGRWLAVSGRGQVHLWRVD